MAENFREPLKLQVYLYTLSEQKYFNTVKSTCTKRVIYRLNIEL